MFHLKDYHTKDVNLKFQLTWSNSLDVVSNFIYIAVAYNDYYVSFIMVTITRHLFINIFQMQHLWAVKFHMGYKKNMSFLTFLYDTKISKSWEKSF